MGWGNEKEFKWFMSHVQDGAMPIYGKTFKNLLLWNQKADDLFYSKVKFGPFAFVWENA